jgi:MSHA biogenesis protein MshL
MRNTGRLSWGAGLLIGTLGVFSLSAHGQSAPQGIGLQRPVQGAPLPPAPVTQLEERATPLKAEQMFSLSFSEPVPIKDLLLQMVRDTSLSVVLDPDVDGTFTGELKNVTLKQALDSALRPLGLQYATEDNILRVFRQQTETRIFNVNYVATRRTGSRGTGTNGFGTGSMGGYSGMAGGGYGGAAGGYGNSGFGGTQATVSGTDGTDFFDELQTGVKTLTSGDGRMNLDRKAGILQVTDYADRLEKIASYLEIVQTRVNRQVSIQAQILEVDLNQDSTIGINWAAVFKSAGNSVTLTQQLTSAASTNGFTMGINIRDFIGLVKAFETQGHVNVLSSPRVAAMNNEPAVMRVGTQDVFFATLQQVDVTTGRLLQTAVTPQSLTEGVVLSVTPQISGDGLIHMAISPTITERTGTATSRLGDTVPILAVRETDTLVRVHDGETVVIGGLMQERVTTGKDKVPVLGDLPLLGGLFRQDTKSKRKTELVIMLTPTVMTPAEIAADAARQQEKMYELQRSPVSVKR